VGDLRRLVDIRVLVSQLSWIWSGLLKQRLTPRNKPPEVVAHCSGVELHPNCKRMVCVSGSSSLLPRRLSILSGQLDNNIFRSLTSFFCGSRSSGNIDAFSSCGSVEQAYLLVKDGSAASNCFIFPATGLPRLRLFSDSRWTDVVAFSVYFLIFFFTLVISLDCFRSAP
jgi:hypothetical protein